VHSLFGREKVFAHDSTTSGFDSSLSLVRTRRLSELPLGILYNLQNCDKIWTPQKHGCADMDHITTETSEIFERPYNYN
jgi:hypothetical protein